MNKFEMLAKAEREDLIKNLAVFGNILDNSFNDWMVLENHRGYLVIDFEVEQWYGKECYITVSCRNHEYEVQTERLFKFISGFELVKFFERELWGICCDLVTAVA